MAVTADVSSVSAWSKATEQRIRKPKQPGRYVLQSSTDYHRVSHSGSTDEDADSLIEALEQHGDSDVGEVERALGRHSTPCQKALPRPSKAPVEEREGEKGRKEISDFKKT
eukprot:539862-Amphidinium_carterae.1